ncbi:MAG: cytochrome C oxidase subunit IV family protein, partial [Bacteroidota bacterium]
MADHVSHSDAVKGVYRGLALLAIVTLVEVVVSLFGKGHILGGTGLQNYTWILVIVGIALIALSLYKAYFIVYEFMHMAYEVKGLALSVLLPTLLLVWALIAFFNEGNYWKVKNKKVQDRNAREVESAVGMNEEELYQPFQVVG